MDDLDDDLGESLAWLEGDADPGGGDGDSLAWLDGSGGGGVTRAVGEDDGPRKLVPLRITDLFDGSLELTFLD